MEAHSVTGKLAREAELLGTTAYLCVIAETVGMRGRGHTFQRRADFTEESEMTNSIVLALLIPT